MPFATDTTWPEGLLEIFEWRENNRPPLLAPYDTLLNYCFGDSFDSLVSRQDESVRRNHIDYAFVLVICDVQHRPVLLIDVKDDSWAVNPDLRVQADQQVRDWYSSAFES
jgi:hypothetical protein